MTTAPAREFRPARLRLFAWSLPMAVLALLGIGVWVLTVVFGSFIVLGVGLPVSLLVTVPLSRWFADLHRLWVTRVMGVPIARPYRPYPTGVSGVTGMTIRLRTILTDPATWRDLAWLLVNATLGFTLCLLTFVLLASTLFYAVAVPILWEVTPPDIFVFHYGLFQVSAYENSWGTYVTAALLVVVWWLLARPLMRGYARLAHWLLSPGEKARLAGRVAQLTEVRDETVDTQAAEVRRIERDLHDGAQARLVALGMSLGMAEEMLASDPQAAQELLSEARTSTSTALSELRDLVRGIHPPVLADRGLDGAIRALALVSSLRVEVDIELDGRPPAPVESAAYFAVAETLTNAAKHAGTPTATVRIRHADEVLYITVHDAGRGGATAAKAGGLHGIGRRLAAFDGSMTVDSPPGGPTAVNMEVPCALSSAKISPSSETG